MLRWIHRIQLHGFKRCVFHCLGPLRRHCHLRRPIWRWLHVYWQVQVLWWVKIWRWRKWLDRASNYCLVDTHFKRLLATRISIWLTTTIKHWIVAFCNFSQTHELGLLSLTWAPLCNVVITKQHVAFRLLNLLLDALCSCLNHSGCIVSHLVALISLLILRVVQRRLRWQKTVSLFLFYSIDFFSSHITSELSCWDVQVTVLGAIKILCTLIDRWQVLRIEWLRDGNFRHLRLLTYDLFYDARLIDIHLLSLYQSVLYFYCFHFSRNLFKGLLLSIAHLFTSGSTPSGQLLNKISIFDYSAY